MPRFTAVFSDVYATDAGTSYEVQVSASSTNWATATWDSGKTPLLAQVNVGSTSENITYAGTTLANNQTYYWRIKFWDLSDVAGAWSTTTASFVLTNNTGGTSTIQDLVYKYDSVGNITSVTDIRSTSSPKSTVYAYDDLYRLLFVGTTTSSVSFAGITPTVTVGTSTPYRTWAYNTLGNITSATNKGTYTYAGTGYANPHAPTTIGSTTLTYDTSGNLLTGYGTNTWNYRGELFKVASGTASTTFSYDSTGERLEKKTATTSTRYISPQYELTVGATTTPSHLRKR